MNSDREYRGLGLKASEKRKRGIRIRKQKLPLSIIIIFYQTLLFHGEYHHEFTKKRLDGRYREAIEIQIVSENLKKKDSSRPFYKFLGQLFIALLSTSYE